MDTSRSQAPWSALERLGLGLALLLALALRLYQLDQRPVWCDESYFWICANHPGWLSTLLHTMADDVYPPLYFLLLHGLGLFTSSLELIRLPSALAGVATVAVLAQMLKRVAGPRVALFAAALAAASPVLVYYSQELKMYSFLALFLLLLLDETLRCLEEPARSWKRLALWALLSVYTFYLSLIVWFCLLAAAAWANRQDLSRIRNLAKGYAIAAIGFLPWAPLFLKSILINRGSTFNFLMDRVLLYSYQNFSVGFWAEPWLLWAGLALFGLAVARGMRGLAPLWLRTVLASFSFLPLGLSWVVALCAKPIYSDRAMLASSLGWLALAAFGLARLPRKAGLAWLALMLGFSALSLQHYYFDPSSQRVDYKPAWIHILAEWKSGDSIFHQDLVTYYPFKFYALQEARDPQSSPYHDEPGAALFEGSARVAGLRPNWIYTPPPDFSPSKGAGLFREAWRHLNAWLTSKGMGLYTGYPRDFVFEPRLQQEALPGVKRIWYLNTQEAPAARIWMPQMNVYRHGFNSWTPFEPEKLAWLRSHFRQLKHEVVNETDIYLFERRR